MSVILLGLATINVISCAAGAWGMATVGAELFGGDILAGTSFDDKYRLAAASLACVGLVQLCAVVAHLTRRRWAAVLHAMAGMAMMVFIFVEVLLIDEVFFLQPLFFGIGALQLSLSPLFMGMLRPFFNNS